MTKLWTSLGSKLGEQWLALLFSPALAFWALGTGLVFRPVDWTAIDEALATMQLLHQLLLAAGALLLVTGFAAIVRRVRFPALRLLEGYWPRWLGPMRALMLKRSRQR